MIDKIIKFIDYQPNWMQNVVLAMLIYGGVLCAFAIIKITIHLAEKL